MTTVALSGGIATFTGLADNTAEATTLLFTGGGLTSVPSVPDRRQPGAGQQARRSDADPRQQRLPASRS